MGGRGSGGGHDGGREEVKGGLGLHCRFFLQRGLLPSRPSPLPAWMQSLMAANMASEP